MNVFNFLLILCLCNFKMVLINYCYLLIVNRNRNREEIIVNLVDNNFKPEKNKQIRMGFNRKSKEKTDILVNKDNEVVGGIYYEKGDNGKYKRKYQSLYKLDYIKNNHYNTEIVLYAYRKEYLVYLYIAKKTSRIYYGVTDGSCMFKPKDGVILYYKSVVSPCEVPSYIKLGLCRNQIETEYYLSKDPRCRKIKIQFAPRIFSSCLDLKEKFNNNFEYPEVDITNDKNLLKTWINYKNNIPRKDKGKRPMDDNYEENYITKRIIIHWSFT